MSHSDEPSRVVLVVEDEPLVRLLAAEVLLDSGFRVIEAANAAEALKILHAGVQIDVLLADVDMPPGINGYALAQQVHGLWPVIEILLMSGRRWPGEGDLPPGAQFLPKPCPNGVMVAQVRAAAERARAGRNDSSERGGGAQVVPFPKTG